MERQKKGKIINLASDVVKLPPSSFLLPYACSKAAIHQITQCLARSLGPSGICINSIAPGLTATEANLIQPDAEEMFACAIAMQWFLRNREGIDKYADELEPVSYDNGFIFWIGHVLIYRGEQKALSGEAKTGIDQMWEGIETIRATGSETCLTRLTSRMADACRQAGEIEGGLKIVDQGLEFKDRLEELYMEAELLRLKGELLRLKGADEREAEECFRAAIKTAQGQEARSLELRAVMSLSRLLQKQGRAQEAKPLLEEVYGWFTEGFDRPDLQDAKALLGELS